MILVNIGCGAVFHPAWINLDSAPVAVEVRALDARGPLPFADASVDAVYHAHLLEHLEAEDARRFLAECHRILRPGGVIRVVVPDLEGIAQAYLREMAAVRAGGDATLYDWARLELLDQAARSRSGGNMRPFLTRLTAPQVARVRTRAGAETDAILAMASPRRRRAPGWGKIWLRVRRELARILLLGLGGRRMQGAFDEGWFRQGGEVHRVMYDEVSLGRLLRACGFAELRKTTAVESRIPGYAGYELDAMAGVARKPDSLYLEAVRPAGGR
ncbi:MAG TPA: methyltransferase domain-containing protein [Lacunisphaera sp.]|nr:methyltransferase domain-containing protein [Lacunisphaera sp.]